MAMTENSKRVAAVGAALVFASWALGFVSADEAESQALYPCTKLDKFPFCDQNLPSKERVHDLVSRLTLEEKSKLLVNKVPAIERLGLPSYEWWQEALHGVASSPGVNFGGSVGGATSFPQPILTAASFNKTLFNRIAQVISTEARAMHNEGQAGLTFWAPNINIFRDPRWGRGQETPGEDPFLTSTYAAHFVRGMQEDGDYSGAKAKGQKRPQKLKVSACCKHFTAYDLDQWMDVDRFGFDAIVKQQDLLDTYNPPFESCVQEGEASSLMCSYNRVNGVPSCADYDYLTGLIRGRWGFDGYIVSDCDAVQVMYANSKYAPDPPSAIASALMAGMDLNCGETASTFVTQAIETGILNVSFVDAALHNSFRVLFRLGYFDGNPRRDPDYGELDKGFVCTEDHQKLALEAALQSVVLLKNDGGTLPLSPSRVRRLAVLGPNGNDSSRTMLGNYAGEPCRYVTPLQGLSSYVQKTDFDAGCANGTTCEGREASEYLRRAGELAKQVEAVVLVVGLSQDQEREGFDRTSLRLPGRQEELIRRVSREARGRPLVLVLMTGGPVDIAFAQKDPNIGSILWVGYPGEAGGKALAQIVFGDRNPAGKLPMSWYPESYTEIPMTDMGMRPDRARAYPGRTYRFYTGDVLYKFGFGMSYTSFTHKFESAPHVVLAPATLRPPCSQKQDTSPCSSAHDSRTLEAEIGVSVRNEGSVAGTSVVLLYHSSPNAGVDDHPSRQLVGFDRVVVQPNEQRIVVFRIDLNRRLRGANSDGSWSGLMEGVHTFSLGEDELTKHKLQLVRRTG